MPDVRAPRLRRATTLVVYWAEDRLVLHNFATGVRASGGPLAAGILHFFDDWKTVAACVGAGRGADAATLRRTIAQLERATLLQRWKPGMGRDLHAGWTTWNPAAGFFHFSTKDDWAALDDIGAAEAHLKSLQRGSRPPAMVKVTRGARRIPLPSCSLDGQFVEVLTSRRTWRRFGIEPLALDALSALTHLTWGIQAWGVKDDGERIALKTSPSGGALQPVEVYVLVSNVAGLSRGLYHYRPDRHELETIPASVSRRTIAAFVPGQWWFERASALFLLTVVFTRKQWRYRFPRAYRSVLLEAGHFAQTFCLVATRLGLAPFCTQALADRRIEKALGIDGIRESVVYATGVGPAPPPGQPGTWPEHAPQDPWKPPRHRSKPLRVVSPQNKA